MLNRLALAVAILLVSFALSRPVSADQAKADNTVAVCGCGKVFTPDAKTEYLSADGQNLACCSHACHETAAKDPAAAAKMTSAALSRLTEKANVDMTVANVTAVGESGTMAVCGCGKEFTMDGSTPFIHVDGEAYACCSKECHAMAEKDPRMAAQAAKKNMASHK